MRIKSVARVFIALIAGLRCADEEEPKATEHRRIAYHRHRHHSKPCQPQPQPSPQSYYYYYDCHHQDESCPRGYDPAYCPPGVAQTKILESTALLQQYFSTCFQGELGPLPPNLINPDANVTHIGQTCPHPYGELCCQFSGNFVGMYTSYYRVYCQNGITTTWINQQPPSVRWTDLETGVVTFVTVENFRALNSSELNPHQVSYFWKRRSGCDFWVDHVEYREPTCTSLLYVLPCDSICPPI